MKHFTITTETEAAALRPFASEPIKVGHIVTPCAGSVTHTAWDNYPEADALTFEECMAVVRDEVTEEVIKELGGNGMFLNINDGWQLQVLTTTVVELAAVSTTVTGQIIESVTATKIKLLAAILRGEDI